MDLHFFKRAILTRTNRRGPGPGCHKAQAEILNQGEQGDIILPLLVCLMASSFAFGGLFWLNLHFEKKTKEHLNDFQTRWNHLVDKYKN